MKHEAPRHTKISRGQFLKRALATAGLLILIPNEFGAGKHDKVATKPETIPGPHHLDTLQRPDNWKEIVDMAKEGPLRVSLLPNEHATLRKPGRTTEGQPNIERAAIQKHARGDDPKSLAERRLVDQLISENYLEDPATTWYLLQICQTRLIRNALIILANQHLEQGKYKPFGLKPLTPDEIAWCEAEQVQPITLASAVIAHETARTCIQARPDLWLDGFGTDARSRDAYLGKIKDPSAWPSPKIIAKLEQQETSSGIHLGDVPYYISTNTRSDLFPSAPEDMTQIAEILRRTTRIPYDAPISPDSPQSRLIIEEIPSSVRGNPMRNHSGGAIMGQLMPIHLLMLLQKYEETKESSQDIPLPNLYPSNPLGLATMKALYLYAYWNWNQGKADGSHWLETRYPKGGGLDNLFYALRRWNPSEAEVRAVINSSK